MDASTVPLICYFAGNLSGTNSADYVGGGSTASFINKSIPLQELRGKVKMICGLSHDTVIRLKCRYPLNQSMAIALDICDESSLAVVMASIPTLSSSLVVYVEEVSNSKQSFPTEEVSKQSFATLGPSTIEGVDRHLAIASPSESCVLRTPHRNGRGRDIGWLHCRPVGDGTSKTQCNYCGKVMSGGGITRMKQHLAGGNDVEKCTKCGVEVRQLFRDMLRKKKQPKSSSRRLKAQRYEEDGDDALPDFEDDKEISPMTQCQLSAGVSFGRADEEIALMDADSDGQR
ncbi:hypothetical protein ACHQM5_023841 [Ranunculus cassubicifolius]